MATPDLTVPEARGQRDALASRTDVLDKVGALTALPDGVHVTTEMVAAFYEVAIDAVYQTVTRNRDELGSDGYVVLARGEVTDKLSVTPDDLGMARTAGSIALFPRRAVLRIGMLLRDSGPARQVRDHLLDTEQASADSGHQRALNAVTLAEARMRLLVASRDLIGDTVFLQTQARHVLALGMGAEPEIPAAARHLTVSDYLAEKGVTGSVLRKWSGPFGKLVKARYVDKYNVKPPFTFRLVDGAEREVGAYTEVDRHLFDTVWDDYYAHRA